MGLRLPDHWVWDTWYAVDGATVHAFFLQAPRSIGDPEARHTQARIGHAVSHDLRAWKPAPFRLDGGPPGSWDELATWTGSVIRDDAGWLMAYSGIAADTGIAVQRIGFARSTDLCAWTRGGPVLEADPRWYEGGPGTADSQWRDPWAWRDGDGRLHLFITARANHGADDGRGVIGHAWSDDGGASFEVGPPVSVPGELRQLEVPQLVEAALGRWAMLACCRATDHAAARLARPGSSPETGTVALEGPSPLGPFTVPPGPFLDGDPEDRRYAGRIVELGGRRWFLAWLDRRPDGSFAGELADPVPVETDSNGRLRLVRGAPASG